MRLEEDIESVGNELDNVLPASVDRRQFIAGTVATMAGAGLSGCSGDGSGSGATDSESSTDNNGTPIWRYGWKAEPSYSIGFIAEQKEYWKDENIAGIDVKEGFGSGDAAKRVGSGKEELGMASVFPQVISFAEGAQYKMYGAGKPRSQMGLIYRTEAISGSDDLAGKTISRSSSAPQKISWPYFRDGHGYSEGDINVKGASEEGAAAQLSQGKLDGVYDTISDFTAIRSSIDTEVEFLPLYNVAPIFGYPLFVNTSFLEDQGTEYMAKLMTGYSKAAKWVLLNPEETIEIMKNDVNTDLQTVSDKSLMESLKSAVFAVNTTQTVKENGFGYLDTDILKRTIKFIGNETDIDPPSVDEISTIEVQKKADLATFSDEEWKQVTEFSEPYGSYFE